MLPFFFSRKYDCRKQLYYMLTNDQAADLVKTLLVKAKKRGSEKKKKKKRAAGAATGLDSLASLTFFFPP